jgi:hypothetical protein
MLELIFCSNCNKSFDFYKTNYICNHCNFLNPLDLSKTNYYNYLSLLPIYNLNQQDLENNYLTLSIKVHPDNFIKKSQTENFRIKSPQYTSLRYTSFQFHVATNLLPKFQ